MGIILGFLFGVVVGGLAVIVFGKNNKKHIEQVRSEVVGAYSKGETELKNLIDKWQKKS